MAQNANGIKRYYIAAMSKLNSRTDTIDVQYSDYIYRDRDGQKIFKGFHTNEVPTYFLLDHAISEGFLYDRIVFFTTKECQDQRYYVDMDGKREQLNTKEFVEGRIANYIEQHADEQYREKIKKYLGKQYDGVEDLIQQYIKYNVKKNYVEISSDMNNDQLYHSFMSMIDGGDSYSKIEIYYDITGGLRLPQFVSMLLIRAMEDLGASVKRVVYADITRNPKMIKDCTDNYKISTLFNGCSDTKELQNRLKKLGIHDDVSGEDIRQFEETIETITGNNLILSASEKKRHQETAKNVQKIAKNNNGLVVRNMVHKSERAEEKANVDNPFAGLIQKYKEDNPQTNDNLIMTFHEELFKAFYCIYFLDLIEKNTNTKNLLLSIKYALNYYLMGYEIKIGKKTKVVLHSVIDEAREMLHVLIDHPEFNAVDLFENRMDLFNERYDDYHNDFSLGVKERDSEDFIEYMKNRQDGMMDENGKVNMDLKALFKIENVYFNYGFPFYYNEPYPTGNNSQWPKKYYQRKLKKLAEKIDTEWVVKKDENKDQYREYINQIEKRLIQEIPFQYKNAYWQFDPQITGKAIKYDSIEAFLKTVMTQMEMVRPFRNDIAHHTNRFKLQEKADMANQIRKWLEEYREFTECYMKEKKIKVRAINKK